jgi:carboxypeptidase family protein
MTDRLVRNFLRIGFPVTAMLLLMASPGIAQDAGNISGIVTDAVSQTPIPSAQVQIVGTTRGVVTGDDGRFRISDIRPDRRPSP